jgi:polyisoprenoid-binding protein YceI
MKFSRSSIALSAILFSALVFAAASSIDKQASGISVTFTQLGVPVDAKFTRFTGTVDYDPASIAAAAVQLSVDVASFDIGDAEYNKEVLKNGWFNAAQFPQATFTSSSIKALGADKLQAQGKLTIKGKALDITVPVMLKQDGKIRTFSGVLPIKRLYFNIGEGEWKDTDTLADEVTIKFKVVNTLN